MYLFGNNKPPDTSGGFLQIKNLSMNVGLDDLPTLFDLCQRVVMMLARIITVRASLEISFMDVGGGQILTEA